VFDPVSNVDELWAWLYQPVQDLKALHTEDPDKTWEEHRAVFLERLGLSAPSNHPVAEELFRHLDELPPEELTRLLGSDELDDVAYRVAAQFAVPQEEAEAVVDGHDEAAWGDYLRTNGAQWDGTAQSWEQFRDWFHYHAVEAGLGTPAGQFLDYVNEMPIEERIATFGAYGVVIQTAAVAEPAAEETEEEPDFAALDAEILAEHPELADIPVETRRQWAAEAAQQNS
jgi:hypothetical protein